MDTFGCCDTVARGAATGAAWMATGAAAVDVATAGAVVAGAGAGCRAGAAGLAVGAACGATGVDGDTRWTTTGCGFATGRRLGVGSARNPTAGVAASTGGKAAGVGSVAAWTSAGWVPAGRAEKAGVSLPDGPARKRGIAAAAATAPASKITATIRSIELMFTTPDAESITRTRYRQHETRA